MGSTFLTLTNQVLRKLNEVELTSTTFASATGFHSLAKDAVNDSINRINQDQSRWPFNYAKRTEVLVVDQQEYALPSDKKIIDWSTFFLEADDDLDVNASTIPFMSFDDFHNRLRVHDDALPSGVSAIPQWLTRTRGNKILFSPTPDKTYTVTFFYWTQATPLVNHGDTTTIPIQYDHIIKSGAMGQVYDFRENYEMSGKEYTIFNASLKSMKALEIDSIPAYAYDTRTPAVSGGSRNRWSR